jgi:N-acetylglucosaminyldiphosphoundecaprenol N-acetyl-beta-D-mannosaminyltransferase
MAQPSPNSAETAIFHSLQRRARFRDETVSVDSRGLDLRRRVYSVLGIVVDAVDMGTAIAQIEQAAKLGSPFLIATPNLNFLVQSRIDQDFKETILDSDLCLADGMLVVWLARLMGLPIKDKVSGSDLFEILKVGAQRLKIFFFGGPQGIAEAAADALNSKPNQLTCVGYLYPGVGSVEELSDEGIINSINTSEADFLAVSLGAKKGQLWLQKNHKRLTVPVRAHLGAVLAFQAGSVRRAPRMLQKIGFEWLWRIKEEPYLCGRYINDGCTLLYLLLTRVVPLAAINRWSKIRSARFSCDLIIRAEPMGDSVFIRLTGAATERHAERAALHFESTLALASKKAVVIDLSSTQLIDSRFLALLVLFRRNLKNQGSRLIFVNAPRAIKRAFVLNELGFLLVPNMIAQPDSVRK